MTPFEKRSDRSALIICAAADMKIRNMSPRTIDTYTYQLARSEGFLNGVNQPGTPKRRTLECSDLSELSILQVAT